MKNEGLTSKQVQYMQPDPAKRLEIPAGPPSGLYLVIHQTGKKSWALRYRWHGRPNKLTFTKKYPDLSLAAARAEAVAALANLERGIDPAAAKAAEEKLEPNSVSQVGSEWLERYVKPRTRTHRRSEFERILTNEVMPAWNRKLISEVSRADVLRLLDSIVDRDAPVSANRTFEVLRSWFNWCVERGIVSTSPVAGIRAPSAEKSRDRVLEPGELAEVWCATEALGFPFEQFFRMLTLTAQRRSEVANIQWKHVNIQSALWTLPAEVTKANRIHDVPLSQQTLELLENIPRFDGPFIFTTTAGKRPVSGFSKAKGYLNAEIVKRREAAGKLDTFMDWRLHDLRRTAATQMAKSGVAPHVLSAILNHTPGSTQGVTSIYNRFRYTEERREALEKWANYVVSLAEPKRNLMVG